jgi:hypothetical protein
MRPTFRFAFGALCTSAVLISATALGAQQRFHPLLQAKPNPHETVILGSGNGPVLDVNNSSSNPLNVYGVVGSVTGGPYGIGLVGYGANAASGNIGAVGLDSGPGGYGVVGTTAYTHAGLPTSGTQTTGVLGSAAYGSGVVGETSVINESESATFAGVVGIDETTNAGSYNDGVLGESTSGIGVLGQVSESPGTGVAGIAGGAGMGVLAESNTGNALKAYSNTGAAIDASNSSSTVATAYLSNGGGGQALSVLSNGAAIPSVAITNANGDGIDVSGGDVGVFATAPSGVIGTGVRGVVGECSGDYCDAPLSADNQSGTLIWYVDPSGGTHSGSDSTALGVTRHGYYAESYSAQATSRTIEDVGSANLIGGSAVVHIDPSFAESIDPSGYEIFLTPDGDTRGLFVASKGASSFVVHECQGGRSTLAFDYRIVAHPYSHATERLRVASSPSAFGWPAGIAPAKTTQFNAVAAMRASQLRNLAARHAALNGAASGLGVRPGAAQSQTMRPAIEAQLSHMR